ncbi:MAG: hypothetical protein WB630_05045 [Candidatus Acidiferrales bacterium]
MEQFFGITSFSLFAVFEVKEKFYWRTRVKELERPPSWKGPFLQALEEPDKRKLSELVHAAQHAIFLRQRELRNSPDDHEEESELYVAIAALLTIKTHKLGWS